MIAVVLFCCFYFVSSSSLFNRKILRDFSFSSSSSSATVVDVTGAWRNQLGSYLYVYVQDSNGNFVGEYNSAVGNVSGNYTTFGSVNSDGAGTAGQQFATIFFGVNWGKDAPACSVWSGIVHGDVISTTWLLSTSVNATNDLWSSTRVGQDIFVREYS